MAWGQREPLTPEWRRVVRQVRSDPLRQDCELNWRGCLGRATEVDHTKNRDSWPDGKPGRDSIENSQHLCHSCHAKKTSIEQQRKRKKNKEAAKHPWTRMKHPGLK